MRRTLILAAAAVAAFACTAIRQQKALSAVPDNAEFHNLRVLPPNITHDQLIATMQGFTAGLGVSCDHCHVRKPGGGERDLDFASDVKPEKNVARTMLRMVRTINDDYVEDVSQHGQSVNCYTCHRGKTIPENVVPVSSTR